MSEGAASTTRRAAYTGPIPLKCSGHDVVVDDCRAPAVPDQQQASQWLNLPSVLSDSVSSIAALAARGLQRRSRPQRRDDQRYDDENPQDRRDDAGHEPEDELDRHDGGEHEHGDRHDASEYRGLS